MQNISRLASVILTATLLLPACKAPPSVQKVIDEAKAQEDAAIPRLEDTSVRLAQEEGREVYDLYLLGDWAPQDSCDQDGLIWTFNPDNFKRPQAVRAKRSMQTRRSRKPD